MIPTVAFDFGGVLADDGFLDGLAKLATQWNCNADWLKETAVETIYNSGFVNGQCDEKRFWKLLAQNSGIPFEASTVRETIIDGFTLRPGVIQYVQEIRLSGYHLVLLSDHTNWLDELDQRKPFFHLFHRVYNSYHVHKNKREGTIFPHVLADLGIKSSKVVLIDDNPEYIDLAKKMGLVGVLFTEIESVKNSLGSILSQLSQPLPAS
jgi:putative hydrolase of the HAD superfamily